MNRIFNNTFIAFILMLVFSSFVYSEVYQCEANGKVTFQQIPCVEEAVEDCDENYDYVDKASAIKASFDDKYCYYRQLDREDSQEKARLLKEYQGRRDEALLAEKRNNLSKKVAN